MEIFETIFSTIGLNIGTFLLAVGAALLLGIICSTILSFRVRTSKRFFVAMSILPAVVAMVISLLSTSYSIAAGVVTLAVALGLVRFRSANGSAEEMVVVFIVTAIGLGCGLGYLAYTALGALVVVGVYVLIAFLHIFDHKNMHEDRLLKVTIPESLDYSDMFNATFDHYLEECEMVGVKTTGMGSMFRLSYRIKMKNQAEEKEMIDELRTKNGNLEISVLPYTGEKGML